MRADALGLWWEDRPVVRVAKEVIKRTPPKPVWLEPDYLPGLQEAIEFRVPRLDDQGLLDCRLAQHKLLFDIECYRNYFLIAFASLTTGAVWFTEMYPGQALDLRRLNWILANFTIVGFNSIDYDTPILNLALAGKTCAQLKEATNFIIYENWRPMDVLKHFKVRAVKLDQIDLIEVAPLRANLKIYGGRLHVPRMQDLPFHPEATLSEPQQHIVRWYCVNDLTQTGFLYESLKEQIQLREAMGREYRMDLRSKSDAQIAESVIAAEVGKLNHARPQRPEIAVGTQYRYNVPHFIKFSSQLMNWALNLITNAPFIVEENGAVGMPVELKDLELTIAGGTYRMGIGGLHSSESKVAYHTNAEWFLSDRDVVSYYPKIILNLGIYPPHLGPNFLRVYNTLVEKRVQAKKAGEKVIADSLKITVNGSFGKLGSKYSVLYAPDLLIQTTVTGQLSLLMLIERLEMRGIHVVSANTDGVVIYCRRTQAQELEWIIKEWERDTGFETEETRYVSLYSRDVNNYIAVKEDLKTKTKGAYANPWDDPKSQSFRLHKNPTSTICIVAAEALLTKNIPTTETIRKCRDISKFVTVRSVKGGAVKDGVYLGKSIRWYYAKDQTGEIVYALTGNKVPRSDGAKPVMALPTEFPDDIDYDWYDQEATRVLRDIAYLTG